MQTVDRSYVTTNQQQKIPKIEMCETFWYSTALFLVIELFVDGFLSSRRRTKTHFGPFVVRFYLKMHRNGRGEICKILYNVNTVLLFIIQFIAIFHSIRL